MKGYSKVLILMIGMILLSSFASAVDWWDTDWISRKPFEVNATQTYDFVNVNFNFTGLDLATNNCTLELRIINNTDNALTDFTLMSNTSTSCEVRFVVSYVDITNTTYYVYYNNSGATDIAYNESWFYDDFSAYANASTDPAFLANWDQISDCGSESIEGDDDFRITGASCAGSFWQNDNGWVTTQNFTKPLYVSAFITSVSFTTGVEGIVSSVFTGSNSNLGGAYGIRAYRPNSGTKSMLNRSQTEAGVELSDGAGDWAGAYNALYILNDTRASSKAMEAKESNHTILATDFASDEQFRFAYASYHSSQSKDMHNVTMVKGNYYTSSPALTLGAEESTGITIDINSPLTNESFAATNFTTDFNISNNLNEASDCNLYINNTLNDTVTNVPDLTNFTLLNATGLTDGVWTWIIGCNSSIPEVNTTARTVYIDFIDPIITSNLYQNDTIFYTVYNNSIFIQFNFSDANLYLANLSDTVYNWSISNIGATEYVYNTTLDFENHTGGTVYNITAIACDGHTSKEIDNWANEIDGVELKFDDSKIKIRPKEPSEYKTARINKLKDRYSFEFERYAEPTSHVFYVESTSPIEIARGSKYEGHLVIPELLKWIDFEDGYDSNVKLNQINDYLVEVEVKSKGKAVTFNSIGQLNCRTDTFQYYYGNVTLGYPSTTFEGVTETYFITFTTDSVMVPDINISSFEYNSSIYNSTKHIYADKINFTNSLISGYLEYLENRTLQWNYTVFNESLGDTNYSTDVYNQTGYRIRIRNCNATFIPATTVNVTFYEEENVTRLNASIDALFAIGVEFNRSFNFTHTAVPQVDYCIFPFFANVTSNVTFVYTNATGFDEKSYYIVDTLLTNVSQNVSLYLTLNPITTNVFAVVYDSEFSILDAVLVKVQRYYPAEGVFRTVQQSLTGWDGHTLLHLKENVTDYKFTFSRDGAVALITTPMRVLCKDPLSYKCIISFNIVGTDTNYLDNYGGIGVASNWSWNNETRVLSYAFDDPGGTTQSMRLEVVREEISGSIVVCNTTLATSSGTITCNASAYTTGILFAKSYRTASPSSWLSSYTVTLEEYWRIMDREGLFWGFMLIITVAMTASYSPAAAVAMTIFGMIGLFALRITAIDYGLLITFICLGVTTLVTVIRHRRGGGYL